MFTIVNNNMVNGIRRVSVERGYDPRDFVLVGAGGATAAHISALAREMGIETIILPKLASGLCAFGQIISDVKYNYMATSPGCGSTMPTAYERDRHAVRRDRGQGRPASARRRLHARRHRHQAQPGHALCRAGARMHGGHRHIPDQRRDHRARSRTPSTAATRSFTPTRSGTTRWRWSTSKSRCTAGSTSRNPPALTKGGAVAKARSRISGKAIFSADGSRRAHAGLRRRAARRRRHRRGPGDHRGSNDDNRHRAGMDRGAA